MIDIEIPLRLNLEKKHMLNNFWRNLNLVKNDETF